jgi:putative RecB family exonuclease
MAETGTKKSSTGNRGSAKTKKGVGGMHQDLTHLLPVKLSPSRITDYIQCPKLFYYKSMLGHSTPATVATCKGTLAHYAFEKVFDHPREERTAENAVPYVRVHWAEISSKPEYLNLTPDEASLEVMICDAEQLVRNWFNVERPHQFDPADRELYLKAETAGIDVHGFIDRLDKLETPNGVRWYISDYKTGKTPADQYLEKAFFAMNVYALLATKVLGIDVYELRLVYVKNGSRDDIRRQKVDSASLKKTETKLGSTWKSMKRNAESGDFPARKSVLCQWCHFQSECPAWAEELANIPMLDKHGTPYPR